MIAHIKTILILLLISVGLGGIIWAITAFPQTIVIIVALVLIAILYREIYESVS